MKLLKELSEEIAKPYKKADGYYYFMDKFGKKPQEYGPFQTRGMALDYQDVVQWRNSLKTKK